MDYHLISADDHLDIRFFPQDLFVSRVPAKLQERVPHVVPANNERYKPEDGQFDWVADGRVIAPWGCYDAAHGSGAMWAIERGGVLKWGELRPTTPELREADMDRDGVQASVMYGPPDPFDGLDDVEVRRATFRAYNDWLLEFCATAPQRFVGVAQLDYEDPEFSADELERTAKAGIKHVNVLAARAKPSWYDPAWERFWSIAEETGVPVGSHLAVVQARDRERGGPNYGGAVFSLGQQLVEPYAGLILTGMFDRHPKVKTVMGESGIAWVPNMIQTLQRGWRPGGRGPQSARPPIEYFRDNIWMTFQDDEYGVRMLKEGLLFEDKVMWASDYPHPASTWPDSKQVIERQMTGIPEATRKKLLADNAKNLYKL
ncbi:MAG: amidohydrolase [Chloroflexi bacterium]|nr:amidohydrolase [Chloroflexota bacterium]